MADVNNSAYGLHIGVFTRDLRKAFYAYENIEAGGVLINEMSNFRIDSHPYGGVKDSGLKKTIDEQNVIKSLQNQ